VIAICSQMSDRLTTFVSRGLEKVPNWGSPKSPPFRGLSECCRWMQSQFGYAPHTLLDRKIGRSPQSIFSIGLYGPPKNQTL
jgi:hypothetical protein